MRRNRVQKLWERKRNSAGKTKIVATGAILDNVDTEAHLENLLENQFNCLGLNASLIGRQIELGAAGLPDMLAVTEDGRLCIIEVKKTIADETALAQLLSYGAWASSVPRSETEMICQAKRGVSFIEFYRSRYGRHLPMRPVGSILVLVALGFTERCQLTTRYLRGELGADLRLIRYSLIEGELTSHDLSANWPVKQGPVMTAGEIWLLRLTEPEVRAWNDNHEAPVEFDILNDCEAGRGTPSIQKGDRVAAFMPRRGIVGDGRVHEIRNENSISATWRWTVKWQDAVFTSGMECPTERMVRSCDPATVKMLEEPIPD